MNKNGLYVLASFTLGVLATAFFMQMYPANTSVASRGTTPLQTASVVGSATNPEVATTTSDVLLPVDEAPAPKKYEYKFLRDVDPCTMNKLGADSWQISQFGTNIETTYGYDGNCRNGKMYDVIDWTLFSREKQ